MASQITNYQCPACTGPLHFSAASGKLECEFCGSVYEVAQIEALYAPKDAQAVHASEAHQKKAANGDWDTSGLSGDWGSDAAGMRSYGCPSCGAELICESTTAATACPYCGNPTVVPGQFSGTLRPDYVIPFKLEKKDAIDALKRHYKGKFLLPGTFSSGNTVNKIQGVYVPFWLFDGEVSGEFRFEATKSRRYREGNREITETDHYRVIREGALAFEKVPVDASTKMPDAYMDSIEPFHYADLKPFSTAYLPGFLADKYDVSVDDSKTRADMRCMQTTQDTVQSSITAYETCTLLTKNVQLNRGKVHYALLPVWLLNVKWNNQDFLFAVNGQTGATAGDLPVSKGKAIGLFAALAAIFSTLSYLLSMFMMS